MNWFAVLSVLCAIVVVAALARSKSNGGDIAIAQAPQRAGLLYGYYGCYGKQVEETAGHANLLWVMFWEGVEKAFADIKLANVATVIDLDSFVLSAGITPRELQPDAEKHLRDLFGQLQAAGLLHLVRYLVPCDEPNLRKDGTIDCIPEVVAIIRRVVADYPELAGVKVGVCYSTFNPMQHIEIFDIVGFDDYEKKSSIFSPGGAYEQMRVQLRPDQRTWIFPGACYGQDPDLFLNYANAHAEVLAIVPFLWSSVPWETAFAGIAGQPEMREAYSAVGARIVSAQD